MKSVYVKDREFYKDIPTERNNRKKYIHIDRESGSSKIFAMLDEIDSDTDTEYIAEEPNPDNKAESRQLLTPEATAYVVEGEILDTDEPPAKKILKKATDLNWKSTSKFFKAKMCIQEENVLLDIPENANPLLSFEGTTNLNELAKHICNQTKLNATQNGTEFPKILKKYTYNKYQLYHVDFKPAKLEVLLKSTGVRNVMTKNRFMNILQNLHFTDTQTADKYDKAYKMRIVIII